MRQRDGNLRCESKRCQFPYMQTNSSQICQALQIGDRETRSVQPTAREIVPSPLPTRSVLVIGSTPLVAANDDVIKQTGGNDFEKARHRRRIRKSRFSPVEYERSMAIA